MIIQDQKLFERIEAFTKFARFVSAKFGVSVILDGTEAKTDGSTIYLPNIASMDQDEIEFLYCILLHEVGHIRHSDLSKEIFSKLKSEHHFIIFNAIEDARMENLLMKEYAGAEDIFVDLYHRFANDVKFMKRVFGFGPEDTDQFYSMMIYVHYTLIALKTKLPAVQVFGKAPAQRISALPIKRAIDKLLSNVNLKSTEDAVTLSTKIYDLFFKSKKDTSEVNTIPKQEKLIKEALQKAAELQKKLAEKDTEAAELRKKIRDLRKELQERNGEYKPFKEQMSEVNNQLWKTEDKECALAEQKALQEEQKKLEDKKVLDDNLAQKKEALDSLKKEFEDLEKKIKDLDDKKSSETNSEKVTALRKELAKLHKQQPSLKKQIKKATISKDYAQRRIDSREKGLNDVRQELVDLQKEISQIKETPEELQKQIDELTKKSKELQNGSRGLEDQINNRRSKIEEIKWKLEQLQQGATKGIHGELRKIQDECNAAGIPLKIIPDFQPLPGWDDANKAQQQFDQQATDTLQQPVVNGGLTGTNIRDVLIMIEQGANDLKEIDLTEIFKQKYSVSKLETFNDIAQIKNTQEKSTDDEGVKLEGVRKHLPLTTQFDKVTTNNSSSGNDLAKLRSQNIDVINQVKRIFREKLHYQKKLRFKGGQDEGELDSRSMWKLATHTGDDFWEIPHPMKVNQVAASIAIDISGSMEKKLTERQKLLQEITLVLSDALNECFIRHEICGYHAPVCDEMRSMNKSKLYNRANNLIETVVYKTFMDKRNLGIENVEVQCTDNSDGESLQIIGSRLIRERSKRKLLFIVLDGKPFLSGSDTNLLDRDLNDTVEWLLKNKVEVYALGLDKEGEKFFGRNFFQVKDPNDLVRFAKEKVI